MGDQAVVQRRVLRARKAFTCGCGSVIGPGNRYAHTYEWGRVTKQCVPCGEAKWEADIDDEIMDEAGDTAFGASDGGGWE